MARSSNNTVSIILQATDRASAVVESVVANVAGLGRAFTGLNEQVRSVTALSFAFNEVSASVAALQQTFGQAYSLFIGQNVQLQEQLLATQSSLAATNKVFQGGVEIGDPTEAIKALEGPVRATLEQIRKDSLELVGVTSAELVPIFQILAQESSNIGASLADAGDLTVDFAASLGTLGIPLEFARQEIASILQGQISSDSQLAKSIGLNNEQVNLWKQQGTLVENLRERLEAFRAGNALAAQTIGGVTSNIQEVLQETARIAGEPLLEPIVAQLSKLYDFLFQNQDLIQETTSNIIGFFLAIGERVGAIVQALLPSIQNLGSAFGSLVGAGTESAANSFLALADAAVGLVQAIAPVLELITGLVKGFTDFAGSGVGQTVIQLTAFAFGAQLAVGKIGELGQALKSGAILLGGFRKALQAVTLARFATGLDKAILGLGALQKAAAAIKFTPVIAGLGKMQIALVGLQAAAAKGTLSIGALAIGLKGVAAGAIAAAAPIAAVATAIGLVAIAIQAQRLKDVNDAIDSYQDSVDVLGDTAFDVAGELNALNQAEQENGGLTEEQARRREALIQRAQGEKEALEELRTEIENLKPANDEQIASQENLLKQITSSINVLDKYGNQVELAGDKVRELQNRVSQLQEEAGRTQLQISLEQSEGTADLQEQLAEGLITEEEFQVQREQIIQAGAQKQLAAVDAQVAELKAKYAELSDEEKAGAQDVQDEITKLEKESADLRGQIAQSEFNQKKALRDQELKEIEKAQREALNEVKQAETQRQIEIQQLRNQGLITEEEAAIQLAQSNQTRIQGELAAEQEKLAALQQLQGDNEEAIAESQQKILDLTKAALEEEERLIDAQINLIRSKLEDRALAYKNTLEAQNLVLRDQIQLYEALESALQNQARLLEAAKNFQQAQNDGLASNFDILAGLETSEIRRRELQQAAAIARLEGLREAQRIELAMLEIQQQQNQLAIERRAIENEIAIAQQQADIASQEAAVEVARAQLASGRITQAEFEAQVLQLQALQQGLGGLEQQRGLIAREQALQPALDEFQRQTLLQTQETQTRQAQAQVIETAAPGDRRRLREEFQREVLGTDTGTFLNQNRAGLRQAARDSISGESNFLDQIAPGRTTADDIIQQLQGVGAGTDLSPQFEPLRATVGALQPLQTEANGFLAQIAQNTAGQPAAGGGATINNTFNISVANGNDPNLGDRIAVEVERKLDRIFTQGQQLSQEAA